MGDTVTAVGPDPARVRDRADLARELDLLRARAACGTRKTRVSLSELAVRIGEPRSTVHAYVAGRHLPASDVLDRIVIALGATPAEQQAWNEAWFRVAAHRGRMPRAAGNGVVPHQLLPDVESFSGRTAELAALDRCLDRAAGAVPAMVISALAGAGGVGKTALAARWAHRVADAFPDGQLWVNLHGYDRDQPRAPSAALGGFLRALGVSGADIPIDVEERAAMYRSLLQGRRLLVVLDNARDTEQVRLLLPGSSSCQVVVTSRDGLVGLVARYGAHRIELDVLPAPDAVELVSRLIGDRARSEPSAAIALVERCGRLPLALRIASELAVRRRALSLAELTVELADEHRLMDLLDAEGDPRTSVRAVFSWSYRHCDPASARAFRLLGLVPGPDIDAPGAAALLDTTLTEARRVLARLTSAHLIGEPRPGRYAFHDLLRVWAAERACVEDSEADRHAALARLFDWYLYTASVAMDLHFPREGHRRPVIPAPESVILRPADAGEARRWLDVERANLVSLAATYAQYPTHVMQLSAVLEHHLKACVHLLDAVTLHTHALVAARGTDEPVSQVRILNALGSTYHRLGRYAAAEEHLREALAIAEQAGDQHGQALALTSLGIVTRRFRRFHESEACSRTALRFFRALGDRTAEAGVLTNLGALCGTTGRHGEAACYDRRALAIARDLGNRGVQAAALSNLGVEFESLGEFDRAVDSYLGALSLHRELGEVRGEALCLRNLADVAMKMGDCPRAVEHNLRALGLSRQVGDRLGEAAALNNLGLASQKLGDVGRAEQHWRQALSIFENLGLAEAAEIRAALADMGVLD